ncbi:MAG: twin-arginine translocase TatA/TatE family subunit [Vampirovibrionales bacterium]|nr:twin-arginine translocase TatA/TatE family subunit [Vampirovibrionales bacterium]
MPFNIGPLEIALLFLIVLILFGPGRLPDVFRVMGEGVRQFKRAARDISADDAPKTESAAKPPAA